MIIGLLFSNPLWFFIVAIAILLALSIHEYSHAWMAYVLGDSTAKEQGRLTINPLAHMDTWGTILLFTVGIGWGKPVPFNPYNLKNRRWGEILVGLAGPVSNFLFAVIAGVVLRLLNTAPVNLFLFFSFFVWINLLLGIFNLLPIPPLDGSHFIFNLPFFQNFRKFFYANSLILILLLLLFMQFVGIGFIVFPLFQLITGINPNLLFGF